MDESWGPALLDGSTIDQGAVEYLKFAHERWCHEDHLINHRLTWLLTSQGLLFAALGAIFNAANNTNSPSSIKWINEIVPIIWAVGLSIALVLLLGICAAIIAQMKLRATFSKRNISLGVMEKTTWTGRVVGLALPLIFALAWEQIAVKNIVFDGISQNISVSNNDPDRLNLLEKRVSVLESDVTLRGDLTNVTHQLLTSVVELAKRPQTEPIRSKHHDGAR